ncbi:hypothetical protein [Sinomonas sp.]|uniref:hypothetical protein n=1 Tax=Sinomonas sp. TaxID=1914986 RepID=UPI003F820688
MTNSKQAILIRRLGGFGASLLFSTVVNLIGIPFVIVNLGAQVWAELSVALAAAAVFGIVVSFGWGTVGAAMTAATPRSERPLLFVNSLASRGYLFLFSVIPMILVMRFIAPSDPVATGAASFAYLLPFLGASWYFVGQSMPWRLFFFDVLPQGLGIIFGVIGTFLVREVWVYVASLVAFNLAAVLCSALVVIRYDSLGSSKPSLAFRASMARLAEQWHAVVAASTGTVNSSGPIIAVTLLGSPLLPVYALADKIFKYGVAGFGPVLQLIQGWIPEAGPSEVERRVRRVSSLAPWFGLLGGLVLALVMPWAAAFLSAGRLVVGLNLSVPFGIVFAGVLMAQVIGLACLIPIGLGHVLAKSTAFGAAINLLLFVVLGIWFGGLGIAWSVAAAEVVVAGYQLLALRRYFLERSAASY